MQDEFKIEVNIKWVEKEVRVLDLLSLIFFLLQQESGESFCVCFKIYYLENTR